MVTLIRREFRVAAPVRKAWDHLSHVSRWPSWAQHIRAIEVEPAGAIQLGSRGRIRLKNGVKSEFTVVEVNELSNWKWVGRFLWLMVHYDHRFEPSGGGHTRLVWIISAEGAGVKTLGRIFAVVYRRSMERAIPFLVAEMEQGC